MCLFNHLDIVGIGTIKMAVGWENTVCLFHGAQSLVQMSIVGSAKKVEKLI